MRAGVAFKIVMEIKREMRRYLLTLLTAALVPAATAWAAPATVTPSGQYLMQISDEAVQLQAQADRLESFVRSRSTDAWNASRYTLDMADSVRKLASLLDAFVAQPGTTNDTRQQVERMKVSVAELGAFAGNAYQNLDAHAVAVHAPDILASIANIMDRGNALRAAVRNLSGVN